MSCLNDKYVNFWYDDVLMILIGNSLRWCYQLTAVNDDDVNNYVREDEITSSPNNQWADYYASPQVL